MNTKQKRKVKVKTKKLINSFKYASEGFLISFKRERNMKIHIFIMILVIIAGELFNTAIEATVDIAMPYKDKRAKLAKDVSASAVLVLAIASAIIGGIIFIPKILNVF